MNIQEYILVEGSDPQSLSEAVNKALTVGWTLYGSPVVAAGQFGITFFQAVVREIELPGAWG